MANRAAAPEITTSNSRSITMAAPHGRSSSKSKIGMTSQSESVVNSLPDRCRIRRVPDLLRKNEKNAKIFDPAVVAIGPYHRDKPHLLAMEEHKKVAAAAFAGPDMDAFYNEVFKIVGACRDCYDEGPYLPMNDEDFAHMLFFDACFILHFIDWFVKKEPNDFTVSAHLHGFILRDMFLLENQLPYLLLEKLMEVKSAPIDEFLDDVAGTQVLQRQKMEKENCSTIGIAGPHPHLLARLQEWQLGQLPPRDQTRQLKQESCWLSFRSAKEPVDGPHPHVLTRLHEWRLGQKPQLELESRWLSFRSAKELVKAGVVLRPGETAFLRDVKFEPGLLRGILTLPQIVVDNHTRPRLLNMIAFEMCSSTSGKGYGIMSFVWFLNLLIDRADDVKELRQARVLVNMLPSDDEVAVIFNEMVTDLVPDQQPYHSTIKSINNYYNSKIRVSVYRTLHRRFGNPWATIAFFAGAVLLVLTIVQTVLAVIQTYYTVHPPTN